MVSECVPMLQFALAVFLLLGLGWRAIVVRLKPIVLPDCEEEATLCDIIGVKDDYFDANEVIKAAKQ